MLPDIDLSTPSIAPCARIEGPEGAAVVWMLRQAERALTAVFDDACRGVGLRDVRDTLVLSVAGDGQGHTQTEIAQIVGLDKTTLGAIIDRLEADGYIVRTAHPSNRKVRIPTSTPTGSAKLAEANRLGQEAVENLMSGFSAGEVADLRSFLWRITEAPAADAER